MKNEVFIKKVNSFLPNEPVDNESMEDYIGRIEGKPSRVKNLVLKQNGIKTRYYALNKNQEITHTAAELAARAIRGLFDNNQDLESLELITTATSIPDQILPSHASMVHGLLPETKNIEIFSTSGVCLTSLQALKIAYLSVVSGEKNNAVCCASELVSAALLSKHYDAEYEKCHSIGENPYFGFEKDFLRFMLSDGAGAVYLDNVPSESGNSLKIEWIEMESNANELPACMISGADFRADGSITTWKSYDSEEISEKSVFTVKQDIRLLKKHIIRLWVDHIENVMKKHNIAPVEVDYVIPHVSSMFFYKELLNEIEKRNIDLRENKWFTNLTWVGNMGSASIFVALDELLKTQNIAKGKKILLLVPESGRFSYGTTLISVV
ncbi:3-Oxoacyl-(acyl-carrier-protein (ACP)) synthase III domain-containing protein (plasmid) [Phocaeicola salanitronis DSM 18170]|uniref:3-Oxoacyl-(Acyl-carrier-protein (ACP)) synthase III domain-containing protein n=1 Tax=Phocaeicola salanitronis (strain DSM 18170 / JCM 13657 / CCUG 60908 / BL78) TaxID=667015 RepID=F0R984_PHOSB|nr:beta-ketoacyl-ACP synthase III [Phocaeicola salanitronis]ADY38205.1 3-Oxoacyl-(acyl-carrier-protein (ACP)) synthase III domain-containing protein [Phocaeicola salanitronis DSM 18170]